MKKRTFHLICSTLYYNKKFILNGEGAPEKIAAFINFLLCV